MKNVARNLLQVFLLGSSFAVHAQQALVISMKDSINLGMQMHLERALETAEKNQSSALLIEIDTPGGYLEVTRSMVQKMLASTRPIIVWVSPEGARAASAGAMISMAAHVALMAPSTSIGAATPVDASGADVGESMKNKVTNDTVSFVTGIAEKRGRNREWAKLSVTQAASLTSQMALEKNVIDGIASNRAEVWREARKKIPSLPESVSFENFDSNLKEKALSLLSNPNIAYGLMALGSLGIYLELTHPGTMVPGIIGVSALALGAITTQILPIRPGALVLLLIALVLLAIEVLTPLPTYGVAGAVSLLCFLLSGIFLMDSAQSNLSLNPALWIPTFLVAASFVGFISYKTFRAIKDPAPQSSLGSLVGQEAQIVKSKGGGKYTVSIFGELWSANLKDGREELNAGDIVEIYDQEGLKLRIQKKS